MHIIASYSFQAFIKPINFRSFKFCAFFYLSPVACRCRGLV